MENQMHLAIASVPKQTWNTVYDEAQALKNGTLFPELNLPFYVTDQDHIGYKTSKAAIPGSHDDMLLQVQQVCFVTDELRLYLDTHPDDKNGLKLLKETLKRKKELLKMFTEQFYPLNVECMADIYEEDPASECYCWIEGKIPWETEYK